jgi:CRISPR/Cas system-associated protein endoribonuclease Cas2
MDLSKEKKMEHQSQHFRQFLKYSTLRVPRFSVYLQTVIRHGHSNIKRQLNTKRRPRGGAVG